MLNYFVFTALCLAVIRHVCLVVFVQLTNERTKERTTVATKLALNGSKTIS